MRIIGAPQMWRANPKRKTRRRNARPRPSFKPGPLSSPRTDHTYRGYHLHFDFGRKNWHVFKGGRYTGYDAGSLRDGYQLIDTLVDIGPYPTRNPKRTRVSRCVKKLKRSGRVRSAYGVCQTATRQSYRTGRRLTNPLKFTVGFKDGPPFAIFRSLARAVQYGKAINRHTGRAVRVRGP